MSTNTAKLLSFMLVFPPRNKYRDIQSRRNCGRASMGGKARVHSRKGIFTGSKALKELLADTVSKQSAIHIIIVMKSIGCFAILWSYGISRTFNLTEGMTRRFSVPAWCPGIGCPLK